MFKSVRYYDGSFDQEKFDEIMLATSEQDGLMSKEDKIKLDNLAGSDEQEISVNASDVVQDETHRFVSDQQITVWDAKPETKEALDLGNVTNDAQVKRSEMGVAGGVATLDEAGLIPSAQLPGFVDDVLEFDSIDQFPTTGESGKIYVDVSENKSYRWSGTQYVEISSGIALGETSATAYAGDKGKANAEAIDAIITGITTVPKAVDSTTVNGFAVNAAVPADAKFTDTVYEHPTSHNASMIVESAEKKFVTSSQADKINAIPEDPKYTDTIYEHPETHDASMIVESVEKKFVSDEQIAGWNAKADYVPNVPYYDEDEHAVYGCGVAITIDKATTEGMNTLTWGQVGGYTSIEFPEGAAIYGGGHSLTRALFYPCTCITINGGLVGAVYGGNNERGAVGTSTVIINNAKFVSGKGVHGGGRGWDDTSARETDNIVGHAEVVVNNTDGNLLILYAGGQSISAVGSTRLTVNGGNIGYVTAGGSNGYTGTGEVIINDGTITVVQGCNRGAVSNIKTTINGGTITKVYGGGETEDTSVTATFDRSELNINGGTITSVTAGTSGGVLAPSKVFGTYREGVIDDSTASAVNLTKAPMVFTDITVEGTSFVFKNGTDVVKTIDLAGINA